MPKISYINKRFSEESKAIIIEANVILEEYDAQGFVLTLRQLYYQFVARDMLSNTQKSYDRLGGIINNARLAGLIDWDYITDRTRSLQGNAHWDSPAEIIDSCISSYKIDKWATQEFRPEIWIEKDALVGVIEGICRKLDIDYFSCRGYTSQSEMWRAGQRLIYNAQKLGQSAYIVHLGDHDPSGKDMTRDITDRLEMFARQADIEINRIALNMNQIEKYAPPPNPAKVTDSRAQVYIAEFGNSSWELDALEPKVLTALIRKTVLKLRDEDKWGEAVEREEHEREQLTSARDLLRRTNE